MSNESRQAPLSPIEVPYLLVTGIPCFVDPHGARWTDALWQKDLLEHLVYLKNFALAAPVWRTEPPFGAKCLSDDDRFTSITYVDLPASRSQLDGIINWPLTFAKLWRAVGGAQVIHAGVADWPIPTGWAATLAAKLRRRTLLIYIESAFWRVPSDASFIKRFRARAWEAINRWCVRRAELQLFTQHEYARQMLKDPERGHIFQASWIDEENILEEVAAGADWDEKEDLDTLSILFAGRLIPEKGVRELLHAVEETNTRVRVDFIGTGALAEEVTSAATRGDSVRLLEQVAYGPEFFALLRRYHAVIVPSISDEQPRVVYDAYSQALPVLATCTPGLAECVKDGETGYTVPPGSVTALQNLLQRASSDRPALRRMGLKALAHARRYTHREMHRRRWELLLQHLGQADSAS